MSCGKPLADFIEMQIRKQIELFMVWDKLQVNSDGVLPQNLLDTYPDEIWTTYMAHYMRKVHSYIGRVMLLHSKYQDDPRLGIHVQLTTYAMVWKNFFPCDDHYDNPVSERSEGWFDEAMAVLPQLASEIEEIVLPVDPQSTGGYKQPWTKILGPNTVLRTNPPRAEFDRFPGLAPVANLQFLPVFSKSRIKAWNKDLATRHQQVCSSIRKKYKGYTGVKAPAVVHYGATNEAAYFANDDAKDIPGWKTRYTGNAQKFAHLTGYMSMVMNYSTRVTQMWGWYPNHPELEGHVNLAACASMWDCLENESVEDEKQWVDLTFKELDALLDDICDMLFQSGPTAENWRDILREQQKNYWSVLTKERDHFLRRRSYFEVWHKANAPVRF
ncbi:Protein of unknown function [Pyronema omphalodes CBS 100304]|uniref:Uncharacterized protein n=1 Tax=Pyronema omphalodes (strain CBS 100304) TaxID=1076935 RepID=U4L411_PYROM|nr:Protein of unknown function [Pyronema omphalodes CBS 100304]